jgi:hypothetical protein
MKFELTTESKQIGNKKIFRIKALISFGNVTAGDMGGYIEKEENLSQTGNAWVYGDAQVFGNAWVYGDAQVFGNALVYGDAQVYDNALVCGDAQVSGICINIQGKWNITITDNHIQIGCELHTIKQWFSYKDSRISKMDFNALDWWLRNREWLKQLCETRAK